MSKGDKRGTIMGDKGGQTLFRTPGQKGDKKPSLFRGGFCPSGVSGQKSVSRLCPLQN
jgi:hypothetical protein